jgi:nucleotide-binding universal stress UspA family protein
MRVLLVVDFLPDSERSVAEFGARTWPPGTIVRVLAIIENIPPSAAELWFDAGGSLEEVLKARKERAEELVLRAAALLRQRGLTTETAVRLGRRRKAIAQEAKSWPADRIVAGSRGLPYDK